MPEGNHAGQAARYSMALVVVLGRPLCSPLVNARLEGPRPDWVLRAQTVTQSQIAVSSDTTYCIPIELMTLFL